MIKNPEKEHFERLHELYELHHYGKWNAVYRKQFFYKPMFEGLDLNNKNVIELACGSGHNSLYLKEIFPDVLITGLDISQSACEAFTKLTGFPAIQKDLTLPELTGVKELNHLFDYAIVIGGIHHCTSDLAQTLVNIDYLVKPNGYFIMMEPSNNFILEPIRELWYKLDKKMFVAESERALDPIGDFSNLKTNFVLDKLIYFGGPGSFFIQNSMVLRIPICIKNSLSPAFIYIEKLWNLVPLRWFHNFYISRWRKFSGN